jgi:hypothetical protein
MKFRTALPFAALLAVAGCMMPERHEIPSVNEVVATSEQGGKFISFVGPRRQHGDAFFGVPNTNFFLLRSFIDTRSNEVAHQVFVEDSYVGKERLYDSAFDAQGQELKAIPITKSEITCQAQCSYAEEFAAVLPEPLLRANPQGLTVVFSDKAGDKKEIAVPGELIQKQLTAVSGVIASRPAAPGVTPSVAAAESVNPATMTGQLATPVR